MEETSRLVVPVPERERAGAEEGASPGSIDRTRTDFLDAGQMYFFNPQYSYSKLTMYRSKNRSEAEVIIKRRAVLVIVKRDGNWRNIYCSGFNGWVQVSNSHASSNVFERVEQIRRCDDWRGNNYFYWNGSLMLGCDARFFVVTNVLYISFGLLFYIVILPSSPFSLITGVLSALLFIYSLVNLWITAFTEPGIVPRQPLHIPAVIPPGISPKGWKFCKICNVMQPPRSKHCNACQNCVLEFDHHCPYTSNCVGKRNRRYFVRFIFSVSALILLMFVTTVLILVSETKYRGDVFHAIQTNFITFMLSITSLTTIFILVPFCRYHLYIISIGETTFERIRKVYKDQPNPYNQGCWQNFTIVCCKPVFPSSLENMGQIMTIDHYLRENVDPNRFEDVFYSRYGAIEAGNIE